MVRPAHFGPEELGSPIGCWSQVSSAIPGRGSFCLPSAHSSVEFGFDSQYQSFRFEALDRGSIRVSHPSGSRLDDCFRSSCPCLFGGTRNEFGSRACPREIDNLCGSPGKPGANPRMVHAVVAYRKRAGAGAGPNQSFELEDSTPISGSRTGPAHPKTRPGSNAVSERSMCQAARASL